MAVNTIAAVAACKLTRSGLRIAKRGGTALPGKAAMKFQKNILEYTSAGVEIIVVTGTNGKTTTCRMVEHALTQEGLDVLANKSGANLLSGVTAEFTCDADWKGHARRKYAVIECDEGALKQVVPLIHPKVIVVTNLFRDQLDRYGEVLHTLELIKTGVKLSPESVLCLNADCSLTASIALDVPNKVVWYGMNTPVGDQKDAEISDATHCIRCGTQYQYKYHTYAHLGGFCCPKCGYKRPDPSVSVEKIEEVASTGSRIQLRIDGADHEITVGLPAVYNIYNAAAAICGIQTLGHDVGNALESLGTVHSSFGRMENFDLDGTSVQMILVKNPAGCNQAIEYLLSLKNDFMLTLCLNDRTADGHDISWVWDADYEKLAGDPMLKKIMVSGDRAEDMAVRMKYAGIAEEKVEIVHDTAELMKKMKQDEYPVFVLPNYTSMLTLRGALSQATAGGEFWKG